MKTVMTTLLMTGLLGSALMAQTNAAPAPTTGAPATTPKVKKHNHKGHKKVTPAAATSAQAPATK